MARLVATVALVGLIIASGCWDKKEIEDLGYVRATVIDQDPDGRVRVLVQVPNPRAFGGGGMGGFTPSASMASKTYRNIETKGTSLFEALRQLSLQSSLRLFYAHNLLLIFTERAAKQDIERYLDFLERNTEMRLRLNYVLVTPSAPRVLLDIPSPHDPVPASRIHGIIDSNPILTSRFAAISFSEFLTMLSREGQDAFCGVIRCQDNQARDPTGQHAQAPEPKLTVQLSGSAAFRGGQLAGFLTERETRGLLWAHGRVRGGVVNIEAVPGGVQAALEILHAKSRIIPEIRDGRLLATVDVTGVDADVGQSEGSEVLSRPDCLQLLERALAGTIESEVLAAAEKAQSLDSDVLGVGAAFHRKYPQEWKEMKENWPEVFPTVEITAQAEVTIRGSGLIEKSTPIQR